MPIGHSYHLSLVRWVSLQASVLDFPPVGGPSALFVRAWYALR